MKNYVFEKRLFYKKNEFKHGRLTIVFVHGLSGSSSAWIPYEEKFKKDYNVLSFDLRGHGKSYKPKSRYDYEIKCFSEDLAELLEYLKINNCILVSHSFGTLVALEFLSKYGEKVCANVFLSPSYSIGKTKVEKIIKPILNVAHLFRLLPFSAKIGTHIDYSRFKGSGDWDIPRNLADIPNTSLRVFLYSLNQAYKFDRESTLKDIHVPTLIIHGEKDSIFPVSNAKKMAAKIKNSKLVLLPTANHILVLNYFPEVSHAMEDFFKTIHA